MEYFIGGVLGAVISSFYLIHVFRHWIKNVSENGKGAVIFGKRYFFMSRDQIQKAVKAIVLFEKSMETK